MGQYSTRCDEAQKSWSSICNDDLRGSWVPYEIAAEIEDSMIVLALYAYGAKDYSPEVAEVMDRLNPRIAAILAEIK